LVAAAAAEAEYANYLTFFFYGLDCVK